MLLYCGKCLFTLQGKSADSSELLAFSSHLKQVLWGLEGPNPAHPEIPMQDKTPQSPWSTCLAFHAYRGVLCGNSGHLCVMWNVSSQGCLHKWCKLVWVPVWKEFLAPCTFLCLYAGTCSRSHADWCFLKRPGVVQDQGNCMLEPALICTSKGAWVKTGPGMDGWGTRNFPPVPHCPVPLQVSARQHSARNSLGLVLPQASLPGPIPTCVSAWPTGQDRPRSHLGGPQQRVHVGPYPTLGPCPTWGNGLCVFSPIKH